MKDSSLRCIVFPLILDPKFPLILDAKLISKVFLDLSSGNYGLAWRIISWTNDKTLTATLEITRN